MQQNRKTWLTIPQNQLNLITGWNLTRLIEYSVKLKENGFEDIKLLKSMDTSEVDEMIQIIHMKKKGHILKLKKCISILQFPCTKIKIQHSITENTAERGAESKQTWSTVPKQSILCFKKKNLFVRSQKILLQKQKDYSFSMNAQRKYTNLHMWLSNHNLEIT